MSQFQGKNNGFLLITADNDGALIVCQKWTLFMRDNPFACS